MPQAPAQSPPILVIGATGKTGSRVGERLRLRGFFNNRLREIDEQLAASPKA